MSRPIYVHVPSGRRFRFIGITATTHTVVLQPAELPEHSFDELWICPGPVFAVVFAKDDDLLDVAEAMGVAPEPARAAGEQPRSEFSTGPASNGPLWSDARLASIVERWARDMSGGAA